MIISDAEVQKSLELAYGGSLEKNLEKQTRENLECCKWSLMGDLEEGFKRPQWSWE